ncbi:MAG: glycosyltransferase family 2 protein [Caldisphaera sp.]|uniref:glycosyltransferase family 2 protein n=1 Tax=Caldisphaera sp. TaxID=2060322 RepID=UPI0025BFC115|nr:glycosyltransferase family 2 protein [Caldisphaera sp.]
MELTKVSVITTTYNEEEYIDKLIKKIRSLNLNSYIIVVDDSSSDNTAKIAKRLSDKTIIKKREGQTIGLWYGMLNSVSNIMVTIDADLENPPELIPTMINEFINNKCGVLIASRNNLPRISEKISTKIFKKILNVDDIYSNFRVYSKDCLKDFNPKLGETFGLEFLLFLNKKRCKICQIIYSPPPRRSNPRIGGKLKANMKAFYSTFKSLIGYLIYYS